MKIGQYEILETIARGGMGEVYLAYDPVCKRKIAIKRARSDLKNQEVLLKRFTRETRITAQLTHPAVVPIYTIDKDENGLYYTMPYIEGKTLKTLLKERVPIPTLMRVFLSLCQAIAYAHKQGILHRDIKPENVMVGTYGEVYILDWGLGKQIGEEEEEEEGEEEGEETTTVAGKVFGTVAYMAPERAVGHQATILSDIYSLGMVLYEILSLHRLFKRENLKAFRQTMHKERWIEPSKLAPYRNVPRMLAAISHRCLHPRMFDRYPSVDELIGEIEYYLEGRSEWFEIAKLDVQRKGDWEFQENIYQPNAITDDWVGMMVSKDSFSGNTRLTMQIQLEPESKGIGLLMSVPEAPEREQPGSGYCLRLGTDGSRLFRASVEVASDPNLRLTPNTLHTLRMEKIDSGLHFSLDGTHRLSYISHLPLAGTHIGLLYTDQQYQITDLAVHVGSYSIRVNCLAIPDAFLAEKNYDKALSEYRRIAYSFPERDEGREAQFRAGVTLLEQAKFDEALAEFGRLHASPGAPLEYLGKALVYKTQKNHEEEVKCFELAFRKYRHHPLLSLLEEEVIFRLHASLRNRLAFYRFLLIVAEYIPKRWKEVEKVIQGLPTEREAAAVRLAYLLARPYLLREMIECEGAPLALMELGAYSLAEGHVPKARITAHTANLISALDDKLDDISRTYLTELALRTDQAPLVHTIKPPSNLYEAWAYLLEDNYQEAGKILENYSFEEILKEDTLLHLVYGCYLAHTEGEEIAMAHFLAASDVPYPTKWELLGHFISGKINENLELMSERRNLYRQLHLYFHCLDYKEKAEHFAELEKKQYVAVT